MNLNINTLLTWIEVDSTWMCQEEEITPPIQWILIPESKEWWERQVKTLEGSMMAITMKRESILKISKNQVIRTRGTCTGAKGLDNMWRQKLEMRSLISHWMTIISTLPRFRRSRWSTNTEEITWKRKMRC